MIVGLLKETFPGERRVALIPEGSARLAQVGLTTLVEPSAGAPAGYPDSQYLFRGANILSRDEIIRSANIILQVRTLGANPAEGRSDLTLMHAGQVVVGMADPLGNPAAAQEFAATGATLLALELIPRITRAQSMDILSSMATVAGYKAVLLAAEHLWRMFPMFTTAAGTIAPAKVFVIGAGVAGLQAIATSRRLGALVRAYDVRPTVREQVESLGAKFVELDLNASSAEGSGGYARDLGEDFYARQREMIGAVVAESDVVITTAAIPGKKSPVLVTAEMVSKMAPGSVVVDLAAERGGNCDLTRPDETVSFKDVTILGPTNLPASVPFHASQMFYKNVVTYLESLIEGGEVNLDLSDEVIKETMVTHNGEVVHPRVRELLSPQASR